MHKTMVAATTEITTTLLTDLNWFSRRVVNLYYGILETESVCGYGKLKITLNNFIRIMLN